MTLIEVLITLALVALLTGALLLGAGAFRGSYRRAAGSLIITGVRLGMTRANTTGRPVRMVFDLDQQRVLLEESNTGQMLRTKEGPGAGAEPVNEMEAEAQEEAEQILKGPRVARPRFTPVKEFGSDGSDPNGGRSLGSGVRFDRVQTEHDEDPVDRGRAYLYFWPRGGTEEAAIHIVAGEDDDGLTVRVSALTGRAWIERGRVALPEPRGEEGYSEREEE